jgi:chromosome segregation ATPase
MELQNVHHSLSAACENQKNQSEQLVQQQSRLEDAVREAAEAKAQASSVKRERDAEALSAATLKRELSTAQQRVQELQEQLCKSRAVAARAKLASQASPRKPRSQTSKPHMDRIVIPTCSDGDCVQSPCSMKDCTVDMSALIRQVNVSNRKLNRAVKVWSSILQLPPVSTCCDCLYAMRFLMQDKAELQQQVKELKSRCERLDALQSKLSDRRSELETANRKLTTQLATAEASLTSAESSLQQEKQHHEKKDEQLRMLAQSGAEASKAAKEERTAWLCQLDKAEGVAQDVRDALMRKQDQCQELEHALAEIKGELSQCNQDKVDDKERIEQLCIDLKASKAALGTCEEELESAKAEIKQLEHAKSLSKEKSPKRCCCGAWCTAHSPQVRP